MEDFIQRMRDLPLNRLRPLSLLLIFLLGAIFLVTRPIVHQHLEISQNLNSIQKENQLPGTSDWILTKPSPGDSFHFRFIEGYSWTTSTISSSTIYFSVSTSDPSFRADVYRMGWYGGAGARLMQSIIHIAGHLYPLPKPDKQTGLIMCNWPIAFTIYIPPAWTSGIYLIKLTSSSGYQAYIPFVLRDTRASDFVFVHSVTTDEAYNDWGGTSLYHDYTNTLASKRALKVSFDRPFIRDYGAGQFFWWEYPMIRWLEKNGYDVSYIDDVIEHEYPASLLTHKAILIVGHDEYWSQEIRNGIETAVNAGVNLGVFGGNDGYWQIRFEPRQTNTYSIPDRIEVCYKDAKLDPLNDLDDSRVTVRWRDLPVNRPEQMLLGSMTGGAMSSYFTPFPWVVNDPSNWIFSGTNLKKGDSVPGIVGAEYDKVYPDIPSTPYEVILSISPVVDGSGKKDISNSIMYSLSNGPIVFNAGTFDWSWGLDDFTPKFSIFNQRPKASSAAIQIITSNILRKFLY